MSDHSQAEISRLMARAFEDRLDPSELARLEALLAKCPEFREQYVSHAILQSCLEQEQLDQSLDSEVRAVLGVDAPPIATAKEQTGTQSRPLLRRHWMFGTVVAASLVLLAVLSSRFPFFGGDSPEPGGPKASTGRSFAAKVISLEHCRWEQAKEVRQRGDVLQPDSELQLASGVVRLRFRSGAEVALEGPAGLTLRGANSVTLHHGRLVAEVGESAHGFTVHTPDAQVVDLGTRFGVSVEEEGVTEAHVFEGEIELTTGGETIEAFAGSAIRAQAGHVEVLEAAPQEFKSLAVGDPGLIVRPRSESPAQSDDFAPSRIKWAPARDLTGPDDILTDGALIHATNCSLSPATVSGVDFVPQSVLLGRGRIDLGDATTGDEGLDRLIDSYSYVKSPSQWEITGLEVGARYKLQIILADPRDLRDGDKVAYGDGCDPENSVVLRNYAMTGEPPFGQCAIGTFVAADTSMRFTIRTVGDLRKVAFLSAFVLCRVEDESP